MYGKLFTSIYDGSIYGHWEAIVTFQTMIALADCAGVVDMTLHAMSGKTSIPLEIIQKGIVHLEQPDPESRSSACEGRRIERISNDRTWGWKIVNHTYYRNLASHEEKRATDRERLRQKREHNGENCQIASNAVMSRSVATCRKLSQVVADVAHADADADADTDTKKRTKSVSNNSADADDSRPPLLSASPNGHHETPEEWKPVEAHLRTLRILNRPELHDWVWWSHLDAAHKEFPDLSVCDELSKAEAWLLANPRKAATKKRWKQFILNWFTRATERKARYEKGQQYR
jgi:hypothetical protein